MSREDLRDKKFGKLIVIDKIYKNGRSAWKCLCSCGNTKVYFRYELVNKSRNSCGCDWGLVNKKFNKLFVKKRIVSRGRCKYECKCDCGNIIVTTARRLQTGKIDCGCGIKERIRLSHIKRRLPGKQAAVNKIRSSYIHSASKRDLKYELSNDDFEKFLYDKCFYCGRFPYKNFYHKKVHCTMLYNGIDRKNSNLGYTKDNVVTCCSECNYKKSDTNYDDFIKWIKMVYQNIKGK